MFVHKATSTGIVLPMNLADGSLVLQLWERLLQSGSSNTATLLLEVMFDQLAFLESFDQETSTDDLNVQVRQWLMEMLEDHDGLNLSRWYELYRNNREEFRFVCTKVVSIRVARLSNGC